MAATAPTSTRPTIRELVERAASDLGAKLRSEVRGWHPSLTGIEIEDAFQQACLLASSRCHGRTQGEVFGWLRTTPHRELNRVERRYRFEVLADQLAGADVQGSAEAQEV
jgi:hypothetical protein